ncbi:unnamed protein product [Prunus armeniaca]|uniref:Helicase C-terminal domain-containing protein n=1 Tax=Prunus armeniaca TaxID=36596 RepID=A0A6J5XWP1_PRUAR|nr:unnamed protein product [Prunus armeniaca]
MTTGNKYGAVYAVMVSNFHMVRLDLFSAGYISDFFQFNRLVKLLEDIMDGSRTLIFMETKKGCDQITRQLRMDGWPTLSIHGDKSQAERDLVLSEFKADKSPIMTATDIAAHGLDVKDVKFVINYDFPGSLEDYVLQKQIL